MSKFRLPRLASDRPIIDEVRRPTPLFQRWWQSVVEKIEEAIGAINDVLVAVGIAQETADGSLELAQQAINPDGTIKTDKVLTSSITTDAVTERYLAQAVADITLPDGVETTVVTLTVEKQLSQSEMDIDAAIRLASSDDIQGVIRIYRGGDLVDSFNPFLKGPGGTYRTILTMPFTESNIASGAYEYRMTFTKDGGASTLNANAGSLLRIKEIKR